MASFTLANAIRWTQPSSSATLSRSAPVAGVRAGAPSEKTPHAYTRGNRQKRLEARREDARETRAQAAVASHEWRERQKRRHEHTQARWIRNDRHEHPPKESIHLRPLETAFDLDARLLDERRILDAGGTRGDARKTTEAAIEVLDERRRHLRASFQPRLHQVDPPTRRIHFFAPEQVRRARWQTEAAMHTLVDQGARWLVSTLER